MPESNKTHIDHTRRIFVSTENSRADRTGIYIVCLLCLLGFILVYYLCYNFVSYRRYLSSIKKKKKKATNNFIPVELRVRTSTHRLPHRTSRSLPIQHHIQQLKRIPSIDPYPLTTRLVSDL